MTIDIYRDKSTHARVMIPLDADPEKRLVDCIEAMIDVSGRFLNVRKTFIPRIILDRHYRKETL